MQRSQIFVQNRVFYLPHLHSTPPLEGFPSEYRTQFGMEKLEWCGYPMVKKIRKYLFVLTQLTNVTDVPERLECEVLQKVRCINTLTFTFYGETDRQTPHDDKKLQTLTD